MRDNKTHWLQLAQNSKNAIEANATTMLMTRSKVERKSSSSGQHSDNGTSQIDCDVANVNNNNNSSVNQRICGDDDDDAADSVDGTSDHTITTNGSSTIDDIPKIVGKLGRLDSTNHFFQFKSNGIISESATRVGEATDQ